MPHNNVQDPLITFTSTVLFACFSVYLVEVPQPSHACESGPSEHTDRLLLYTTVMLSLLMLYSMCSLSMPSKMYGMATVSLCSVQTIVLKLAWLNVADVCDFLHINCENSLSPVVFFIATCHVMHMMHMDLAERFCPQYKNLLAVPSTLFYMVVYNPVSGSHLIHVYFANLFGMLLAQFCHLLNVVLLDDLRLCYTSEAC